MEALFLPAGGEYNTQVGPLCVIMDLLAEHRLSTSPVRLYDMTLNV
jgi:hypothetical protein